MENQSYAEADLAAAVALTNTLVLDLLADGNFDAVWDKGASAEALRLFRSQNMVAISGGDLDISLEAIPELVLPFDSDGKYSYGGNARKLEFNQNSVFTMADPNGTASTDTRTIVGGVEPAALNRDKPSFLGRFYGRYTARVENLICQEDTNLRARINAALQAGTAAVLAFLASLIGLAPAAVPILVPIAAILIIVGVDTFCETISEVTPA